MTTQELRDYYANLLILQYLGQPKAYATIQAQVTPLLMPQTSTQTITFSAVAASGSFVLSYDGNSTVSIAWNASSTTIQSDLRSLTGLSSVTVTGSIASKSIVVTFTGVSGIALSLVVASNSLADGGSSPVSISVAETDLTLPLAVQAAFDLSTATGVQLNTIGKYVGVSRNGNGFNGPISLTDPDFLKLIKMAIIRNSDGSSLSQIQSLIHDTFGNDILVFDYANMYMSYLISSLALSYDLLQLFVTEGLLPKPMGVGLSIVYNPVITMFFGFRTYVLPGFHSEPFNDYSSYQTNWPWLSYAMGIVI